MNDGVVRIGMATRPDLLWPCLLAATGPPRLPAGPARLALVLHGAPLIQGPHIRPNSQGKSKPSKQPQPQQPQPAASEPPRDANPLPRIIKPRKRRKKERKQPPNTAPPVSPPPVEEPPSPVVEIDDPLSSPADSVTSACTCSYCDPSNDTWDFTPPTSASSTSTTWDVSSEIVTSANGHRDLEIKFILPPKVMEPSLSRNEGSALPPPWSSREE